MKKIFKIANYDFKRLMFNPITYCILFPIYIAMMLTIYFYQIPTTPIYSTNIEGETTKDVYNNFYLTISEKETRNDYRKFLDKAEELLSIQTDCQDSATLENMRQTFSHIKIEVRKYRDQQTNKYIEDQDFKDVETAVGQLKKFVQRYIDAQHFETNVYFSKANFEKLQSCSNTLSQIIEKEDSIENKVLSLSQNLALFDNLDSALSSKIVLQVDKSVMSNIEANYITVATERTEKIEKEMETVRSESPEGDFKHRDEMLALVTSYKLSCESAKKGVENELLLLINTHFKNLNNFYGFDNIQKEEDIKVELVKINYYLNDANLYYSQSQQPLNFNTASYKETAYDKLYIAVAIIGFLNIIFAIFCAYKLFGRDRKNGKMDIILSQNVTYGQVFAGKVLAILFSTSFVLIFYTLSLFFFSIIVYPSLPGTILAVFNFSNTYSIHPFMFLVIKLLTTELEAMFYAVLCVFVMNLSRKFNLGFVVMLVVFALATVLNIFLNGSLVYCLLPFIHADLSRMLGGGTMQTGFLITSLYASGNFFISLVYYFVVVVLLYTFTNQLFKKN